MKRTIEVADFPVNNYFEGKVTLCRTEAVAELKCNLCGGNLVIHLKYSQFPNLTAEAVKFKLLQTAARRHNCPAKVSLWGDWSIARRIGADIIRGWEKLKEMERKLIRGSYHA